MGIGTSAFHRALAAQAEGNSPVTDAMIAEAEWIADIELDDDERESVARSLARNVRNARELRKAEVDADQVPALIFRPDFFYGLATVVPATSPVHSSVTWKPRSPGQMSDEELAFSGIEDQASLLAAGKVSSRELTELYLQRLKRYDPLLLCVVTLLEEHALEQASASDRRRSRKKTLGILDGIPWLAKDLVAVPPWKTTWGAEPFKDQIRETQATVAKRLDSAGAVLLAKTTLGALAWGDRWFGGKTRNPWNPEQGSSGSSAGSASAVAAGLATFALGSETQGSIVSPCRRCRTSGLRPTFGRVSRAGCMPLAWSMDKIGPIARHAGDLAHVFWHLTGVDGRDPTVVERGFRWPRMESIASLKVGVTGDRLNDVEQQALEFLRGEGAIVVDVDLSSDLPVGAMSFILGVEASTVFDDAFRAEPKADYGNWGNTFRQSQFVPAIQYLRANRKRAQLVVEAEQKLAKVDVVLGGDDLLLTNLTGHPSIVVACGSDEADDVNLPGVVKLTAAAYRDDMLIHVGQAIQRALPGRPAMPPLEEWLEKGDSTDD